MNTTQNSPMTLQQFLETELALKVRSYSGRGMFGKTCLAVHAPGEGALQDICYEAGEAGITVPRASIDSLGKGVVIYWPKVPFETSDTDPRDDPGANPDDGGVENMEAIADAEAQRYYDEGERMSGADRGGRYF